VAKLLLHARANIDQLRTLSGASPLFAAAGHGRSEVVELMLAAGADTTLMAKVGYP
jgi:ankyrin repeat protein|tara:strand:- start:332 stop:499 length:168 start_codon:yes stop_codon:yes gene_type:complete